MTRNQLLERREVHYRGHVQGVGFRFTARSVAQRHEVVGFVRNEHNGQVELVAEGPPHDVTQFLEEISQGMASYIHDTQVVKQPATGEFSDFEIRR